MAQSTNGLMKDLSFLNCGSLIMVYPTTDAGRKFLDETAPADAQFLGDGMAVEPRYVEGVRQAALNWGLE